MATTLDLANLGTLAASAANAKSYRFLIVKRSSGITDATLSQNPNQAGPGIVVDMVKPDAGGKAELDLNTVKSALEKEKGSGEELASYVVGVNKDAAGTPAAAAGPTFSFQAAESGTVEEKQYDYFKTFVTVHLAAIVESEKGLERKKQSLPVAKNFSGGGLYPVEFNEAPNAINVFGIRSMTSWAPVAAQYSHYDDWIAFAWKDAAGKKHCAGGKATVDPTKHYVEVKVNSKGITHVRDGHWRFMLGKHSGGDAGNTVSAGAWTDKGEPGARDNKQDLATEGFFDMDTKASGGTNIHWGEGQLGKDFSNYGSMGCQVFQSKQSEPDWVKFISTLKACTANNSCFPYTLVESQVLVGKGGPVPQ